MELIYRVILVNISKSLFFYSEHLNKLNNIITLIHSMLQVKDKYYPFDVRMARVPIAITEKVMLK